MKANRYIIAIFIAMTIFFASAFADEEPEAIYLPMKSDTYTKDDQIYMINRAMPALKCIPNDLLNKNITVQDFRKTAEHDTIKAALKEYVNNAIAWPEYFYIARLNSAQNKYEYLVSSSDVIEQQVIEEFDLSEGMNLALKGGKPVVTPIVEWSTIQPPAVYIPLMSDNSVKGFLVFVKLSWDEKGRRAMPAKTAPMIAEETPVIPDPTSSAFKNSGNDADTSKTLQGMKSGDFKKDMERIIKRLAELEKQMKELNTETENLKQLLYDSSKPEVAADGSLVLGYGIGLTSGKKSLGGSGHLVSYKTPEGEFNLIKIQIFGSRYGMPEPPAEKFKVYILDKDMKVINTLEYPYSLFERGPEVWVTLDVSDVNVSGEFSLALDFNPTQTKGIYVGFETHDNITHSKIGTPDKGFMPFQENSDWMIKVFLKKK